MLAIAASLLVWISGCGPRVSEAERRQAENRARLATSMFMEGELSSALREARRALEIDPECVDCRLALAVIYQAQGEFRRAEEELLRILETDGENPFALNTLANVYLYTNRPADAEPLAQRASENEDFTGRHLAFYNLGWALYDQRRYDEALGAFQTALRESPAMCSAQWRIAQILFRNGHLEEALQFAESSIEVAEEDNTPQTAAQGAVESRTCDRVPEYHHTLGMVLRALGREQEATVAFQRCAELTNSRGEIGVNCSQQLNERE